MPKRANHGSFKPGSPGGPGRPKGSKSLTPRIRAIVDGVLEEPKALERAREAFRQVLARPKTVLQAFELAARVRGEIGKAVQVETPAGERITLSWPNE